MKKQHFPDTVYVTGNASDGYLVYTTVEEAFNDRDRGEDSIPVAVYTLSYGGVARHDVTLEKGSELECG